MAAAHHVATPERAEAREVLSLPSVSTLAQPSAAAERHATTAITDRADACGGAPGASKDQLGQAAASDAR